MKKVALLFVMSLCTSILCAQNTDFKPKLPDFVPPSPTAYELGKYGDIPVNESTGMANIGVPLYTFGTPNISVPISLSYTTSGIKVNQVASWVGMGWNLNTGGAITRTIRGMADEDGTRSFPTESYLSGLKTSNPTAYYDVMTQIATKAANDYVADLFNFNIDGHSGSFFLDENMNPVLIKKEAELKIEKRSTSFLNGFIITTPQGVQYTFGENNATESTKQQMSCGSGHSDISLFKTTSWHLTKITHPKGDQVTFEYNNSSDYFYIASSSQTVGKNLTGTIPQGVSLPSEAISKCSSISYVKGKVLTKITSNRGVGSVVFTSSLTRADINDYKLDGISIQNPQNVQVKGFGFTYNTIQSSKNYTTNNGGNTWPQVGATDQYKRLFLSTVLEKDSQGNTTGGKVYSFDYDTPTDLPPRMSLSQDELGYYNGKSNQSYFPNSINPGNFTNIVKGDRTFDYASARKGILTKVTYPTKGYTELEYESGPSAIRVKRVKSLSESGATPKIVKYYYMSKENALAGNTSVTSTPIGSSIYFTSKPARTTYSYQFQGTTYYAQFDFIREELSSSGALPMALTNANHFLYKTVTTGFGENFEGGGVEKKFSAIPDGSGTTIEGQIIINGAKTNLAIFNGTLLEETHFRKNSTTALPQKKSVYEYYVNTTKTVDNYIGNVVFETNDGGANGIYGYDINKIQTIGQKRSMKKITSTEYFDSGNVITIQDITYGAGLTGLPTETKTTDSHGDTYSSKNIYSSDPILLSQNRVGEIIQKQSFKGTTLLQRQDITYKNWGTNATGLATLMLPEYIKTSKGVSTNAFEDRIVFHSYYNNGNVKEVSKKDGTHVVYIWGYNQTKPIAKIENATYAQVSGYVSNLESLSNLDTSASSEQNLRNALESMRVALTSAQVTYYTYDELVGVTSTTDPRGRKTTYHYDSFNRLQYVKDHDGKILSKNEYNYKN